MLSASWPHQRIVIRVQRVNQSEVTVILDRERIWIIEVSQHFDCVIPLLVADAFLVKAGGGNGEDQRLQAGARRRLQHVPHVTGFMGVKFINDPTVDIQTVKVVGITGYGLEFRAGPFLVNVQLVAAEQPPQRFGCQFDHPLGVIKHNASLIAGCCRRIHFSTTFTVSTCHVEADARGQR